MVSNENYRGRVVLKDYARSVEPSMSTSTYSRGRTYFTFHTPQSEKLLLSLLRKFALCNLLQSDFVFQDALALLLRPAEATGRGRGGEK